MQKIELCQALPGCCWACGSSNREWYIDTERSIDYYGAVYFCNECIQQWAALAEMLSPSDAKELRSKIENQEQTIFDLTVQVTGLEQAVDGLRTAGSITRPHPSDSPILASPEREKAVPGREESVGLEGGTSSESSDDKGVGELHPTKSRSDDTGFSLNL